jgi:light-regulated signal transduction histidine kinase (bacteriophytochrome)
MDDYADRLDEEARGVLQRIVKGCNNMGGLIDSILLLSRTARQPLNKITANMEQLAAESFEQVKGLYGGKPIEFSLSNIPKSQADPVLVRQVLVNLIGNAVKYSSKCDLPKVEIGSYLLDNSAVYFIKDNGVGFDMRYAEKLFGVFQRFHDVKEFEGSGVGLAIAQNIIQRHGGKIWAEAEPGKGATFHFTL